jgi:hypothetical protein
LFGLLLMTPKSVRSLVSPLRIWGTTSGVRWPPATIAPTRRAGLRAA